MAAPESSKKLRILLVPFFATSHIGPFTDLAVRLATACPDAVDLTLAVTPANVHVVRSALGRHGAEASGAVKIATYPFPRVDGLAPGVENLSAAGDDGWRIDAVAVDEALTRPAQEALIREQSPDAVITDVHFVTWNNAVAAELGVPCVTFSVVGIFSTLVMYHLGRAAAAVRDGQEVIVPGLPAPEIRIPASELPEFLRRQPEHDGVRQCHVAMGRCFGVALNSVVDLEQPYCDMCVRSGFLKRAYFIGPLSLPLPPAGASGGDSPCVEWLGAKPRFSVVYVCFGTFAAISEEQLRELALGLEASGKPFLRVVRAGGWTPPEGWEEHVGERGMLVRGWAPQTAIFAHPAVGVFLTHCGSSSLQEAAAAGVPMLTWPLVFDQFIEERLVTEVLKIGERVWSGPRSTSYTRSRRSCQQRRWRERWQGSWNLVAPARRRGAGPGCSPRRHARLWRRAARHSVICAVSSMT
jgi:hypothetical protein